MIPAYLDPDHELDGLIAEFRRGVWRNLDHALTPLERCRFYAIANRRRPWAHGLVGAVERRTA